MQTSNRETIIEATKRGFISSLELSELCGMKQNQLVNTIYRMRKSGFVFKSAWDNEKGCQSYLFVSEPNPEDRETLTSKVLDVMMSGLPTETDWWSCIEIADILSAVPYEVYQCIRRLRRGHGKNIVSRGTLRNAEYRLVVDGDN